VCVCVCVRVVGVRWANALKLDRSQDATATNAAKDATKPNAKADTLQPEQHVALCRNGLCDKHVAADNGKPQLAG
jgi:hypothetical protein